MNSSVQQLGLMTSLMTRDIFYRKLSLEYLIDRVSPAIAHGQIYFAFNKHGRVVAGWTWALLTEDVAQRFAVAGNCKLHISEWNEGQDLWIVDFVASEGCARDVVRFMRAEFFRGFKSARWLRRKNRGSSPSVSSFSRFEPARHQNYCPRTDYIFRLPISAFAPTFDIWQEREAVCNHGI